jgi:hypothetical protein
MVNHGLASKILLFIESFTFGLNYMIVSNIDINE